MKFRRFAIVVAAISVMVPVGPIGAATRVTYRYTSLRRCPVIDEGENSVAVRCQGFKPWSVIVYNNDDRESLDLVHRNGKRRHLDITARYDRSFSNFGQRVEWRLRNNKPFAAIVRYQYGNQGEPNNDIGILVVLDLIERPGCIIGIVEPGETQNDLARNLADNHSGEPDCDSTTR
jgi:hypothetical protein